MLTDNFAYAFSYRNYKGRDNSSFTPYAENGFGSENRFTYLSIDSSYNNAWAMDIGFGDTTPTATDYDLADGNYDNRKLDITNLTKPTKSAEDVKAFSFVATNNGSENVVVKEIGMYYKYAQSSSVNSFGLIARSVLSTPVTIAPGESYSFVYKITI